MVDTVMMSEHAEKIEAWFDNRWKETPAPLTSSVDIRDAGFKCSVVDTNLFPAGFNNLDASARIKAADAFRAFFADKPRISSFLIIPEAHTRNPHYAQSVQVLKNIVHTAQYEVHVLKGPIHRVEDHLVSDGVTPSALILNNDLSEGIPDELQGLAQPVYPSLKLGWSHRLKSSHFEQLDGVIDEFSAHMGIDAWRLNPLFSVVDGIDFMQNKGLDVLAMAADEMLVRIRQHYAQQGISEKPFLVIKADNGTYGMGVMMIHEGATLLTLNRKQRTRMSARTGSQPVTRVLLQEGVPSVLKHTNQAVMEPVMMMIGSVVVGGFYRVHDGRGADDNLNSPGMYFEPMVDVYDSPQFYGYGVVARLAALAAAREIKSVGGVL